MYHISHNILQYYNDIICCQIPEGGGNSGPQNENQNPQGQGKQNPYKQKQHQHQNQNQGHREQSQGKYDPASRRPNFKNYPPPPQNYKTGLGQGKGKKYDTNTCLFVSGMQIPENKSALRFLEDLMIDDMALDFRPLEIIKLEPPADEDEEEMKARVGTGTGEAGKILVAIFSNPLHVQEILNKAPNFKNSPENLKKYGNVEFEGYLTKVEQTVKRAMMRRVRDLNRQVASIENAGELGLEAKVFSKNGFTHMGITYLGFTFNDSTIIWKSYQSLRKTRTFCFIYLCSQF